MEPMTLGSPVSSNQSQFLPCFLMGSGPCSTTPPRVGGVDFGAQSSPFVYPVNSTAMPNTSLDFGRSPIASNSLFGGGTAPPLSSIENFQHNNSPAPRKNTTTNSHHQTGPPIHGLFDSLRSNQLAVNSSQSNLQNQSSMQQLQGNESIVSMSATQNNYNDSMRVMCSPLGANMSPIVIESGNTQSQELAARKRLNDFWVTIFGFPVGSAPLMIQHFQLFGTVVDKVLPLQNCNWIHLKFSARIEVERALQFNQNIIKSNIMIGVKRCTDPAIFNRENCENMNTNITSHDDTYPKLRALAKQGIELAENEIMVTNQKVVPHRSNGVIDRAMEYLFNWALFKTFVKFIFYKKQKRHQSNS